MQFLVIIPLLRQCALLQQSIGSALLQFGDFDLHVHLQCAEASIESESLVEHWREWLNANRCARAKLTTSFDADAGIYDGISRAMKDIVPPDEVVMTWLGADDVLLPGALATVQSILSQHPEIEWLTGQRCISGPDGATYSDHGPCYKFRRMVLAWGKHDGRLAPFVMQEGTFWKVGLWKRAGGVNGTLRFAGDWDLWRRFAEISPLYTVNFSLARFSRTPGSLSSEMSPYYSEIDLVLSKAGPPSCRDLYTYNVRRRPGETQWKKIRKLDLLNLAATAFTFSIPHLLRRVATTSSRFPLREIKERATS